MRAAARSGASRDALRIGIAAGLKDHDPRQPVHAGTTLLSVEEALSHWLMGGGASGAGGGAEGVVALLLPTPTRGVTAEDLVLAVDGLVLQGGVDVSPTSYGEEPLRPEWAGDRARDEYESVLIRAALAHDRPVLGICRGLQIINVALGGTLYQDIPTQYPGAPRHRDHDPAGRLEHGICFEPGSWLARWYAGRSGGRVNTVHHQAIKALAPDLRVEARSPDGIIEAIRYEPGDPAVPGRFLYGVQWHPEYQDPGNRVLLPTAPLRERFLEAVRERRGRARRP